MVNFKKYGFFILSTLLLLASQNSYAQPDSIHQGVVSFAVDDIDQLYYVDSNGTVYKHQLQNDSVKYYNNIMMGAPDALSAKSANRLLVYYKDLSSVELLDNYLAPQAKINLVDINLSMTQSIAASADGGIWVFDILSNELIKLDSRGQLNYRSGDLRNLIDENLFPDDMLEHEELVYLLQGEHVYVFDRFANYKKTNFHKNLRAIAPIKGGYLILDNQGLSFHSDRPLRDIPLELDLELDRIVQMASALNHVYFLLEDGQLLQYELYMLGFKKP